MDIAWIKTKKIGDDNLNEYKRQRRIAESTKKLYPSGTRIELISMKDPYAPVPSGTRGTVNFVDSMGTIFPEWDNGRSLGVVPGEDSFRKLTQEEIEAENQSESEVKDETPDEDSGITMRMWGDFKNINLRWNEDLWQSNFLICLLASAVSVRDLKP